MTTRANFRVTFTICVLASSFAFGAFGAPMLDQEVVGNTSVGLGTPGAQSFTVGISGYLARLEVQLSGRAGEARSYGVGITRDGPDGKPLADWEDHYLFYQTGLLNNQQDLTWIGFDLPPIAVATNDRLWIYFIDLSTNGNFANSAFIYQDANSDQYLRGELWTYAGQCQRFRDFGADVSFRTYVSPVPLCSPHKATATVIVTNGSVVRARIMDPGCGYTNAPAVLLQGGGGSGATATAVVSNGIVVAINMVSPGSGYTNAPTIRIGSPPFAPTLSIGFSKVRVTQNVVLGWKYVLEASTDLIIWTATGPEFTAESETITSEFDVDMTGRFFRIRRVP